MLTSFGFLSNSIRKLKKIIRIFFMAHFTRRVQLRIFKNMFNEGIALKHNNTLKHNR